MSKKEAFIEMETLNQLIVINNQINRCSSSHRSISDKLREVRKLIGILLDKQQTITMDIVVKEARCVDLSKMEIWGVKPKK